MGSMGKAKLSLSDKGETFQNSYSLCIYSFLWCEMFIFCILVGDTQCLFINEMLYMSIFDREHLYECGSQAVSYESIRLLSRALMNMGIAQGC